MGRAIAAGLLVGVVCASSSVLAEQKVNLCKGAIYDPLSCNPECEGYKVSDVPGEYGLRWRQCQRRCDQKNKAINEANAIERECQARKRKAEHAEEVARIQEQSRRAKQRPRESQHELRFAPDPKPTESFDDRLGRLRKAYGGDWTPRGVRPDMTDKELHALFQAEKTRRQQAERARQEQAARERAKADQEAAASALIQGFSILLQSQQQQQRRSTPYRAPPSGGLVVPGGSRDCRGGRPGTGCQ
jgi:hypothetical protein